MTIFHEQLVDPAIGAVRFSCDLKACRGACCTMPGGLGAPLLDAEVEEVRKALPFVRSYLSLEHQRGIDESGPVVGQAGKFTTPCFEQKACVYVTYEDGIAKCSFEKAFLRGDLTWRKPLSCHLFPLRVDRGITDRLRFEFIPECQPALKNGETEGVFLSHFLKDSLVRAYGQVWYDAFLVHCSIGRTDGGGLTG